MRPPWLFALLFASLCPFYAFGFPSVSPFWGASNLDWLNELRADYPLNSTCVEWSYFDRGRQRNAVCFSLPSNDSVSLNRCSRRSSVVTGGRCASFYAFVHTLGPGAADSLATWRSTATVRTEFFLDQRQLLSVSSRTGLLASRTALVCGVACFAQWPTIRRDAWRSYARRCEPMAPGVFRTCGQSVSLWLESSCTQLRTQM
jgi:hypothetical protein